MNIAWRYLLIPAYPLLVVNALVAALYALLWCRARSWQWREGVLTFIAGQKQDGSTRLIGKPGGQGWSWIVGYASEEQRARADLRVHENVHVAQETAWALFFGVGGALLLGLGFPLAGLIIGLSGGPVFALTYGADFLRHYKSRPAGTGWRYAYLRICYEAHAYDVQDEYLNNMSAGQRETTWGHK